MGDFRENNLCTLDNAIGLLKASIETVYNKIERESFGLTIPHTAVLNIETSPTFWIEID
jgi:hypothetical protein